MRRSRKSGQRQRSARDHAHLLGINHLRMTVKYRGIDARLTNVGGNVVKGILVRAPGAPLQLERLFRTIGRH
jgi:hypothetical protein